MLSLDVPTNWRRWNGWLAKSSQPDPSDGVPAIITPERAVLVTDPFELDEMRTWLKSNTRERVAFYGRWNFTPFAVRIERELVGLNLCFVCPDEAFHAKMRWG